MEDLQNSGVVLLLYWTYFKRADLMKVDWDNPKKSPLVVPYQVEFMKWTVQELGKTRTFAIYAIHGATFRRAHADLSDSTTGDGIPQTPSDGCWEDSLFWISRMFLSAPSEENNEWSPPEKFERSKPSVGKE